MCFTEIGACGFRVHLSRPKGSHQAQTKSSSSVLLNIFQWLPTVRKRYNLLVWLLRPIVVRLLPILQPPISLPYILRALSKAEPLAVPCGHLSSLA